MAIVKPFWARNWGNMFPKQKNGYARSNDFDEVRSCARFFLNLLPISALHSSIIVV